MQVGQRARILLPLDPVTALATSWNADADGDVRTLCASGELLLAGGGFSMAGGEPRHGLAAFSVATGMLAALASVADGEVDSLALQDAILYVGGGFTEAAGEERCGLAAFSLPDGRAEIGMQGLV